MLYAFGAYRLSLVCLSNHSSLILRFPVLRETSDCETELSSTFSVQDIMKAAGLSVYTYRTLVLDPLTPLEDLLARICCLEVTNSES